MQKRPQPKVAAAKQKAEAAPQKTKTAASRSRTAVLLRAVQAQEAAHELLDQMGAAQLKQQFRQNFAPTEHQRMQRLTKLLEQLRTAPVVNQRISRTLTPTHWQQYETAVNQPYSKDDLIRSDQMPSELLTYQSMIQQADRLNALADAAYKRKLRSGNVRSVHKLRERAEKIYEDACLWLDGELTKADTMKELSMRAWLDRDFDYSTDGKISIDCVGVARIHDSTSHYCLTDKRDRKAERKKNQHIEQTTAVIGALQQLLYEPQQEIQQDCSNSQSKLQQLLRNSSSEDF